MFKSLSKCCPTLVSCIQQAPNDIAAQLRPLGLLPQKVLSILSNPQKNNHEKAQAIVDTVLFQVQTDYGVFQSFIKALTAAGPWTRRAVSELQKEFDSYSIMSSTVTTDNAASTGEQSQHLDLLSLQHMYSGLPTNVATESNFSRSNRISASPSHLPGMILQALFSWNY